MTRRTRVSVYWKGPGLWEVWERGKSKVIPTRQLTWTAPGRMVDSGKAGYASFDGKLRRSADGWLIAAWERKEKLSGPRKHRVGRSQDHHRKAVKRRQSLKNVSLDLAGFYGLDKG